MWPLDVARQLVYHKPNPDTISYYAKPVRHFDLQASKAGATQRDEALNATLFRTLATAR
jgi:hypothetical protein